MHTGAITSRTRNSRSTRTAHFLGLRVKTTANLGAYLSTFASSVPTYPLRHVARRPIQTPAIYVEVDGVFTNTAPVDAYRGAGRPEATYVVERIVETAARELKIDPAELRRRNFIQPKDFPYQTPVALVYDTGDYEASLEQGARTRRLHGIPGAERGVASARHETRHRLLVLHRSVRPRAVATRDLARRRRRLVRKRRGARQSDRLGDRYSRARTATARATRRRSRRSSPIASAYRSKTSKSCTAIPAASSSVSARTARVRSPSAARR